MNTAPKQAALKDQSRDLIRAELNLEKWPVWQPAKSKLPPKVKVLRREISLADGSTGTAEVKISPTLDGGALTTEDRKVLYALVKQWEERGKPDSFIPISLKRLAGLTGKKWGSNVIESLTGSLGRLRLTGFIWTNAFFSKPIGETIETVDYFNIISDLRLVKRRQEGVITKEAGYFKFHDLILDNLKTNHTVPRHFDVLLSLKGDIAQLLYTYVDLMLNDKTRYERRSKELLTDDLQLEAKAYKNLSDRKRALEPALKEIEGKPLSTGTLSGAKLELTKDGDDYKVVFTKSARSVTASPALQSKGEPPAAPAQTRPTDPSPASSSPVPPTESSLRKDALELRVQGAELVKHFHELFHGSDRTHLSSKAIDQAVSLIAQHGFDQARHIVGFAHKAAPETGYQPQTFGGILQYTARALSTYQQDRLDEARAQAHAEARRQQQAREQEQQRQEKAEQERDDQRLALLADEQRLSLYHQAADIVLKKLPWLAKANPSGPMFQSMVRAEMLDLLTTQEQGGETIPDPDQT